MYYFSYKHKINSSAGIFSFFWFVQLYYLKKEKCLYILLINWQKYVVVFACPRFSSGFIYFNVSFSEENTEKFEYSSSDLVGS